MQTTIHISLNVPPAYQVDELTKQLTDFGNWLLISKVLPKSPRSQYRHQSLRGLTRDLDATSDELIGEYLKEKYGV